MIEGGTGGPRDRRSKAQQTKESTAGLEPPFRIKAKLVFQSVVLESVSLFAGLTSCPTKVTFPSLYCSFKFRPSQNEMSC